MTYAFRSYRRDDAQSLAELFPISVRGLAGQFYSSEEVEAWAQNEASVEDVIDRCSDGRWVWVAVDETDKPAAYIDLAPNGYIDMMFCHPNHARRGLASRLHKILEDHARRQKINRLTVHASAGASLAFKKWGFEILRRNELIENGVESYNYEMAKDL